MRFLIVTFLCFLVMLGACKKDDSIGDTISNIECEVDTIDIGHVFVDSVSLNMIPYRREGELIFYKNQEGEEIKFQPRYQLSPVLQAYYSTPFTLICENGNENQYKFAREQFGIPYSSFESNIEFSLRLYPHYSMRKPIFADKFHIQLFTLVEGTTHNIEFTLEFEYIVYLRGNDSEQEEDFGITKDYELFPNVTLLNKTFTNVYKVTQSEERGLTELYYNKEFGIVAFKDLDFNLWVFDRFE